MKKLIIVVAILLSFNSFSQKYNYYFLEIRSTGNVGIALKPQPECIYSDIDSLIVEKRTYDKHGVESISERKYKNYSEAFNALSKAGLEFVQFANLPTVGGATVYLVGEGRNNFVIFRKKLSSE